MTNIAKSVANTYQTNDDLVTSVLLDSGHCIVDTNFPIHWQHLMYINCNTFLVVLVVS